MEIYKIEKTGFARKGWVRQNLRNMETKKSQKSEKSQKSQKNF